MISWNLWLFAAGLHESKGSKCNINHVTNFDKANRLFLQPFAVGGHSWSCILFQVDNILIFYPLISTHYLTPTVIDLVHGACMIRVVNSPNQPTLGSVSRYRYHTNREFPICLTAPPILFLSDRRMDKGSLDLCFCEVCIAFWRAQVKIPCCV